jgi:hypothetical protein
VMGEPSLLTAAEWITIEEGVVATGGGRNTSGDCEMDTSDSDRVPAFARTELKLDSAREEVVLHVFYRVEEFGGNHTIIEVDQEKVVYSAPSGSTIAKIEAEGGQIQEFNGQTIGRNWSWNNFDRAGQTYWTWIQFKVDEKGKDCNQVGIRGNINFRVMLE